MDCEEASLGRNPRGHMRWDKLSCRGSFEWVLVFFAINHRSIVMAVNRGVAVMKILDSKPCSN